MSNFVDRVKDFMGLNESDDYDYEDIEPSESFPSDAESQYSVEEEQKQKRSRAAMMSEQLRSTTKVGNVVGMPGVAHGVSEMIVIEPHAFDEMPQVIDALRQRKSVILNMTLMSPQEAQRAVDFVAGGTYAIEGHYERIGDNIFLFAPNCVQVSTPTNVVQDVTQNNRPHYSMTTPIPNWSAETTSAAQ